RVLRDVRDFYMAEQTQEEVDNDANPAEIRQQFLGRFADQEGSTFLAGFYDRFHGKPLGEVLSLLAGGTGRTPQRLSILFRSVLPDATETELRDFLATMLPNRSLSERDIAKLYATYGPDRYSLADRAYLARVHPLALWLAAYLRDHVDAPLSEVLAR